jgi:CRISPR/Cas system-associated protein Cas7 (RAMP superfamily)
MQLESAALRQQAKYEEDEFVKRVNNLLSALREFSSSYNGGHVVNVKRLKEMRKALHDLEKSAWFKSYKDN